MSTPSWADSLNYTAPYTNTGVGTSSYFQPIGGVTSTGHSFNPSWSDAFNYKGTYDYKDTNNLDFIKKYWDPQQQPQEKPEEQQPKKYPWEKALGEAAKGFLSSYAQRFKPGATGSGLSGQSGTVGDLSAAGYGGRIYGGQDGLTFVERGPSQVIQGQPGLGGPIGTALGIAASFIPGLGPGIAAAMPAIGGTIGGMAG